MVASAAMPRDKKLEESDEELMSRTIIEKLTQSFWNDPPPIRTEFWCNKKAKGHQEMRWREQKQFPTTSKARVCACAGRERPAGLPGEPPFKHASFGYEQRRYYHHMIPSLPISYPPSRPAMNRTIPGSLIITRHAAAAPHFTRSNLA